MPMEPLEDKPLLGVNATADRGSRSHADAVGGSAFKLSIGIESSSASKSSNSSSVDESPHAYTDFVSLAKAQDAERGIENTRNALGTINGVYVPCLLNIIGVILFLRLGWGVGQAGVEGMLVIFCLAELQAVLTVLSASTIASNGQMQGGGSYYLISRSLGPEFGGAVGLQFYFLYAVGVSMYLVGFAEEAQQTWFPHSAWGKHWTVVAIATIALLVILVIALIGANAFARVNKYLFVLQFACVAFGALFIYVLPPRALASGGSFTGVSWTNLKDNLKPHFTAELNVCGDNKACTLAGVYAIVFPLATGFMEGLNLSGDLENPGRSLPRGTLAAVGTSCVIYLFLIFTFAAAFPGDTLRTNFTFFQEVSHYEFIVITGVLVSCFSSGLGALFGASRILQAIARDDLFPVLQTMAQGSPNGDEPQYAVLFTWLLTQVFICIGDLDIIAPICTSFFCLVYAGVNCTCFLLQVTGVPNFRPSFRYHTWHLSLLGVVLNLGVMVYLNATYAVVSLLVLAALFMYLYLMAPPTAWGDISQALIYHQVRKFLLRLDTRKAHSKFWRPSILLLTDSVDTADVHLCHSLKKGGLYVIGGVVAGEFGPKNNAVRGEQYNAWLGRIFDHKMKAIPQVVVAPHVRDGYRMLMQTSGLGGMQVNTVVVPWVERWQQVSEDNNNSPRAATAMNVQSSDGFVGLLCDGIILRKNIVVLRHANHLDERLFERKHYRNQHLLRGLPSSGDVDKANANVSRNARFQTIDVWITLGWETPSMRSHAALMLQFAYVLFSNKAWTRHTRIRLIKVCRSNDTTLLNQERLKLAQLVEQLRVAAFVGELMVLSSNPSSILIDSPSSSSSLDGTGDDDTWLMDLSNVVELNKTLQRNSTRTAQVLLALPDPRTHTATTATASEYLTQLSHLTNNLPSTMLVFTTEEDASALISTGI